jgi:hypothetical protein
VTIPQSITPSDINLINDELSVPLFQLQVPIFNVAFVDPNVGGTGRIIEIDSFTLTYPSNMSDFYPSFDAAYLALKSQNTDKPQVLCVVGSADDPPVFANGGTYETFILISGNRTSRDRNFIVSDVSLTRTNTRDIIFTQNFVNFGLCELYLSNLVFRGDDTSNEFGNVITIFCAIVGCNIFRTITRPEVEIPGEIYSVVGQRRVIVKDTLYSMVLTDNDDLIPISISYAEDYVIAPIVIFDMPVPIPIPVTNLIHINQFIPGSTPDKHSGTFFAIDSIVTRIVLKSQLLYETRYKSGVLIFGQGENNNEGRSPLSFSGKTTQSSPSGKAVISSSLQSKLRRGSPKLTEEIPEMTLPSSKGFSARCGNSTVLFSSSSYSSSSSSSFSPSVPFSKRGVIITGSIASITNGNISIKITKWNPLSRPLSSLKTLTKLSSLNNPSCNVLFGQRLPLPPNFNLVTSEGSNFNYINLIDNEQPTCPIPARFASLRFSVRVYWYP